MKQFRSKVCDLPLPVASPVTSISIERLCSRVARDPDMTGLLVERLVYETLGVVVPRIVEFNSHRSPDGPEVEDVDMLEVPCSLPGSRSYLQGTALFTHGKYFDAMAAAVEPDGIDARCNMYTTRTGAALLWSACAKGPMHAIVIDPFSPHTLTLAVSSVFECLEAWSETEALHARLLGPAKRIEKAPYAAEKLRVRIAVLLRQWPEVDAAALGRRCTNDDMGVLTLALGCDPEICSAVEERIRFALPLLCWNAPEHLKVRLLTVHPTGVLQSGRHGTWIYDRHAWVPNDVGGFD